MLGCNGSFDGIPGTSEPSLKLPDAEHPL